MLLLVVLGMGWITALTTFNSVPRPSCPTGCAAVAAVYLTVFNGAMAAGSLGWGLVAREIGVPYALAASAAGWSWSRCCSTASACRWARPICRRRTIGPERWSPSRWRTIVARCWCGWCRIRQADRPAFPLACMRLSQERLRDGACLGVVEHTGDAERVVEWFFVESWAEHLRQHHRVSHADADL